ncbi:MAG: hypothetical protein JRN11_02635 [Nitrososphaerota archaeon]|nr:hypothetical protein [Nitrososphaerota archaeon]MDG7013355.1 hypothetical protein [Nitrososphaerota archaeon]MDG7025625.1 hypothetical protein [Nitrososphaerota archaeon]
MSALSRAIQGAIIFATLFGVPFLYEVRPVLPADIFYSVALGEVLFVVDSALTFVRPKGSYYLGLVLAAVAFVATVSQPAHYQLVASGDLAATATLLVGLATEVLIIVLVGWYAVSSGRARAG